jgi:hypothetical protein
MLFLLLIFIVLLNTANSIAHLECCSKSCLRQIDLTLCKSIVHSNLKAFDKMTRKERRLFLKSKVSQCVQRVSNKNYLICTYTIGDPVLHGQLFPVCREAFRLAYQMTHSMLETLCKEIKEGDSGTTNVDRNFFDRSAVELTEEQIEMQKTVADIFGIRLNHIQKAALVLQRTDQRSCDQHS